MRYAIFRKVIKNGKVDARTSSLPELSASISSPSSPITPMLRGSKGENLLSMPTRLTSPPQLSASRPHSPSESLGTMTLVPSTTCSVATIFFPVVDFPEPVSPLMNMLPFGSSSVCSVQLRRTIPPRSSLPISTPTRWSRPDVPVGRPQAIVMAGRGTELVLSEYQSSARRGDAPRNASFVLKIWWTAPLP